MQEHKVVSRQEWLESRREHLAREKELTRLRDRVSQERRELPWVRVEQEYDLGAALLERWVWHVS